MSNVVPTREVKIKGSSETFIINASDFNPAIHTPTRVKLQEEPAVDAQPEVAFSSFTAEELSKMTVAKLKELPEWKLVKDVDSHTTKGAIVEAILAARKK